MKNLVSKSKMEDVERYISVSDAVKHMKQHSTKSSSPNLYKYTKLCVQLLMCAIVIHSTDIWGMDSDEEWSSFLAEKTISTPDKSKNPQQEEPESFTLIGIDGQITLPAETAQVAPFFNALISMQERGQFVKETTGRIVDLRPHHINVEGLKRLVDLLRIIKKIHLQVRIYPEHLVELTRDQKAFDERTRINKYVRPIKELLNKNFIGGLRVFKLANFLRMMPEAQQKVREIIHSHCGSAYTAAARRDVLKTLHALATEGHLELDFIPGGLEKPFRESEIDFLYGLETHAFSRSGTLLAYNHGHWECNVIGFDQRGINLWNLESGKFLKKINCNFKGGMALSANDIFLAAGVAKGIHNNTNVYVWNLQSDAIVCELRLGQTDKSLALALSSDGLLLATFVQEDKNIRVWDARSQEVKREIVCDYSRRLEFSSDDELLAYGDTNFNLWNIEQDQHVYTTPDDEHVGQFALEKLIKSFALSCDGQLVAMSRYGKGDTIEIWNTKLNKCIHKLPSSHVVSSVAFSPDNTLIAAANDTEPGYVWDVKSGTCIGKTVAGPCVTFSPQGALRVVGGCRLREITPPFKLPKNITYAQAVAAHYLFYYQCNGRTFDDLDKDMCEDYGPGIRWLLDDKLPEPGEENNATLADEPIVNSAQTRMQALMTDVYNGGNSCSSRSNISLIELETDVQEAAHKGCLENCCRIC